MADFKGQRFERVILDETIVTATNADEAARAEQDQYVAGRADIWHTARAMLFKTGDLNPEVETVTDLARFLAGDGTA